MCFVSMSIRLLFILMLFGQISCASKVAGNDDHSQSPENMADVQSSSDVIDPRKFFNQEQAERILGEPAYLSDSAAIQHDNVTSLRLTYTAIKSVPGTDKTGNIYFLYEEYPDSVSAHSEYAHIFKANADHDGVEVLSSVCDDAYFHTDSENFYFIMGRKGKGIFRMKVNKITHKTSLSAFRKLAEDICS